jgi:hypothetical protein
VTTRSIAAGAVAVAALALGGTQLAAATTQPGKIYVSSMVIRDDAISVRIRRRTWADNLRYPRGAEVRYEVVNRGTRRFSLDVLGSTTGVIVPGNRATILVGWNRRGTFRFRAAPHGGRFQVTVT